MRELLVIVVALLILLAFFLLPLIPYRSSGYYVAGGTIDRWDAHVSASYFIVKCGMTFDMNLTTLAMGNGSWFASEQLPGPMFLCFNQPNQILYP
jgi:hypothetical protein